MYLWFPRPVFYTVLETFLSLALELDLLCFVAAHKERAAAFVFQQWLCLSDGSNRLKCTVYPTFILSYVSNLEIFWGFSCHSTCTVWLLFTLSHIQRQLKPILSLYLSPLSAVPHVYVLAIFSEWQLSNISFMAILSICTYVNVSSFFYTLTGVLCIYTYICATLPHQSYLAFSPS